MSSGATRKHVMLLVTFSAAPRSICQEHDTTMQNIVKLCSLRRRRLSGPLPRCALGLATPRRGSPEVNQKRKTLPTCSRGTGHHKRLEIGDPSSNTRELRSDIESSRFVMARSGEGSSTMACLPWQPPEPFSSSSNDRDEDR